jgi:hypothetical protein
VKFEAIGKMRSNPSVTAKVRLQPVTFQTALKGACECRVGRISAHVGDIRVRLAIPFLRPRRRLPLVATIGGFRVGVKPFDLSLTDLSLELSGTLQQISAEGEAHVACETEITVDGKLPVKVGSIHVDLNEDQQE